MPEKSRISLVLEDPEDVFSGFDDRPYVERDLSRNLLGELSKKAKENPNVSEVEFRIRGSGHMEVREVAKRRLARYFEEEEGRLGRNRTLDRFIGTACVILGGAALTLQARTAGQGIAGTLLLLGGWVVIFVGVEYIINDWKTRPKHEALKRLRNASWSFSKI